MTTSEPFASSLTPEEEGKIKELAAAVALTVQASASHIAFCTRGTYLRYLRARSWNVHKATQMLEATLKWRSEFQPDEITWDDMEEEAARGKVFVLDHPDKDGRPVVFMRPRKEKYGGDNDQRLRWVVYVMETASRVADASSPDGKMTWLIDFVGYDRKNQPPWKVSLQTLTIVQNHYPERLGKAVNFDPPMLFELFYKAIRPFVDPVTRDKLVFLHQKSDAAEGMEKQFHLEYLDEPICGKLEEDGMWNFEIYKEKMKKQEHEARLNIEAAKKHMVA